MDTENKKIYVTQPAMPPLDKFITHLEDIWETRWLTNNGKYHQRFEQALCDFLGVRHCSLFSNGTIALIVALQALRISGEVITTPYSFVASTHALHWNGIAPVFCDIRACDYNIDPNKIEALITPKTTALLPVHVYGNPCDTARIRAIADTYGLKVIYDAAHAFAVTQNNATILDLGDLSILSFHATKTFNTIEGGAIIANDRTLKERIDYLKNFGFADEVTVVAPGINGKMNEIQAAYGLLELEIVAGEIARRKNIAAFYRERLKNIPGLTLNEEQPGIVYNYSYFPVLIDGSQFGRSRDDVYEYLKSHNILSRRYFYPLISHFSTYRGLPSAAPANLPTAERVSRDILCLPIHGELSPHDLERIISRLMDCCTKI